MVTTKLLTAEDLLALPDDGYRYELEGGVLRRMPPPNYRHGRIVARTTRHLDVYGDETGLGKVVSNGGVIVEQSPDLIRGPDIAFVRTERLPEGWDGTGYLPYGPDLVVEVISPSDEKHDIERVNAEYFTVGTRLIWHFDPAARTVTARRPDGTIRVYSDADELDGEDVLPGFRLAVAAIFRSRRRQ